MFTFHIILIILHVFFVPVINFHDPAKVTFHGPTIVKDFINCVDNIIGENFQKPGYLIFGNSNRTDYLVQRIRSDILKKIHRSSNYVVEIVNPDNKPICLDGNRPKFIRMDPFNGMATADYFIIIVNDYKDFAFLIRKMIRSRFWNPYAKFIIFLIRFTHNDIENQKYVENVLNCLFYYNVINVIVGVPKAQKVRDVIIYSWRPYDPPKFCGNFNETAKDRLQVENICERGVLKYEKDLFENRIPSDMHGCILQILALERQPFISNDKSDPNIEKLLVNTLFKKLNFSLKYNKISGFRGERNETGFWGGALKELVLKKGHILLGGIFPDFDVHEDFECSSTYLADSYTWVISQAYPSPPWVALSITFHKFVWYSAIVGFILCVLSWKVLGQFSGDSLYNKTFGHCLLNTWLCLLGFSAYIRPKTESLRTFFVFLNLYCIIFLTAYQTKLIDVLQNPTYENQIDTVEELVLSGIKFGGSEELHDLFFNSSDPFDYMVGRDWTHIWNVSNALQNVAVHRNFSVLCSNLELAHLTATLPELNDDSGENNYFSFPSITFSVPLEMIALKGFPFMKEISRSVNRFKHIGINADLRRYFAVFNMRKRAKLLQSIEKKDKKFTPLSIQHLQGGFFALVFGVICGITTLILEICLSNKFVKNKIRQVASNKDD